MMRLFRLLPLLLFLASLLLILSGSPILVKPLMSEFEIPMGTLISWLCIAMLPLSIIMGIRLIRKPTSKVYRFYKRVFLFFFLLGGSWGLLSYYLAGNWAFTFSDTGVFRGSEKAFQSIVTYTFTLISLILLFLVIFGINHFIISKRHSK
jgi:hypothetical protein